MTKNVDDALTNTKRARLQFTTRELLLFVTLTFLGMGLARCLNQREELILYPLEIVATFLGALLGLRCSDSERSRSRFIVTGVLLGWLVGVWLVLIVVVGLDSRITAAAIISAFGMPVFIPVLRLAFRPHSDTSRRFRALFLTLGFSTLYSVVLAIAPTYLCRSHCGCGNETYAAASCKMFAEAEEIYHRADYSGSGIQYAMTCQALLGKRGEIALVDKTFAQAEIGNPQMAPKAGYYFKVLTAQGPNAFGGRKSYIDATGQMTLGYGLIAIPAVYDQTGRNCFIINNYGTIFHQDLGPNTPFIASSITEFDPNTNWVPEQ